MRAFRSVHLPRGVQRGLLTLVILSMMGTGGASPSAPASSPSSQAKTLQSLPERLTLKGIPHVGQLPNYCGPAALSSVLAFWGRSVPQRVIGESVFDKRLNATNGADLLLYAREEGFSAYTYLSSIQELKAQLNAGFPVLILQEMSLRDARGHFRIVIGYNEKSRKFLVRDPNFEDVRSIPYEEFETTWSAFGRWSLLVCPRGREASLPATVRNNPVLHLDLGQAYLRRRERVLARRHFEETLRLEPRNREALGQLASLNREEEDSSS